MSEPIQKLFIISSNRFREPVIPQMRADTDYKKELYKSVKTKIGMDSLPIMIYNQLVDYYLQKNKLRDAMFLVCMTNWGTRFGDTVRVRFCHLFDEYGKFNDSFMLNGGEEKTKKINIYYNNEAIKKIVTMYLSENPREYYDYLFVSESRNQSRITLREIEIKEHFGDSLESIESKLKQISEQKSNFVKLFTKSIITEDELEYELKKLRKKEEKLREDLMDLNSEIEKYRSNAPNISIQTPMKRAAAEVFIKSALKDLNIITENRLNKSDNINFNMKFNTHSLRKLFAEEFYNIGNKLNSEKKLNIDLNMLKLLQDKLMHSNSSITGRYNQSEESAFRYICMNMNLGLDVLEKYC